MPLFTIAPMICYKIVRPSNPRCTELHKKTQGCNAPIPRVRRRIRPFRFEITIHYFTDKKSLVRAYNVL